MLRKAQTGAKFCAHIQLGHPPGSPQNFKERSSKEDQHSSVAKFEKSPQSPSNEAVQSTSPRKKQNISISW